MPCYREVYIVFFEILFPVGHRQTMSSIMINREALRETQSDLRGDSIHRIHDSPIGIEYNKQEAFFERF